jgi:hypothetical protein
MTDFWGAQLRAREIEEQTGLSLADQAKMPLDEWGRLAYGKTPAQAALAAVNAEHEEPQPVEPVFTETATSPEPVGIDPDSPEFFHAWRKNRVSGGEGKGIFDSINSQSEEFRSAGRKHAGRTAWSTSNVVEPPRIEGRYLRHDDQLDHRSARERLSNAANLWQGR